MEEKKNKFLYYLNTYCVERYLDQGSANCGLRARFYIEWNAARKKKNFSPRQCKCGQPNNLFQVNILW